MKPSHLGAATALVAVALTSGVEAVAQTPVSPDSGFVRGRADAPVLVVEFGDFGCSACALFATRSFPAIDAEYIQTGRVRWTFVPMVVGTFRHSQRATVAAICAAEQGAFFPMHDRLYANQSRWQRTRNPRDTFHRIAAELGLDTIPFAACYEHDETAKRAERLHRYASGLPIRGTPAFFIHEEWTFGALPADDFRDILDPLLQQ